MKSIHASFALAVALAAIPLLATAAGNPMAPGEWEISTQVAITGVPYKIPPHTSRQCITAADLAKSHGVPEPQSHGNTTCKMGDINQTANGADWTMNCSGDATLHMTGQITYDSATRYHGTIHMKSSAAGHASEMNQSLQATRVGDCTK